MQRKLMTKITSHFELGTEKILVISGARGVGKTYLINDFAKESFSSNLYFNFEHNPNLDKLFSLDIEKTKQNICDYYENNIDFSSTILILDEFTVSQSVINFLSNQAISKSFKIICASSDCNFYLNEKITKDKTYDNLKILPLYPLDFEEFLLATNNEWYAESIKDHFKTNKALPEIVHNNLLDLFNLYMYIGGMPDAINEYLHSNTLSNITERHKVIMCKYLVDLQTRIPEGDYIKSKNVYDCLPNQLNKSNKKFQYSLLRKGATKKIYENNINYLCDSGYVVKCNKLYDDNNIFKLYCNDVGLLNSLSKNTTDEEFINSLIENYVLQNLLANENEVFFWESKSQAKIDFVARKNHRLYAIEVKNGMDTRSKNYSIFKESIRTNEGLIKISAKNFSYSKGVKFIPLYAVFCI